MFTNTHGEAIQNYWFTWTNNGLASKSVLFLCLSGSEKKKRNLLIFFFTGFFMNVVFTGKKPNQKSYNHEFFCTDKVDNM